jgi:hypothetical protein
MQSLVLESYGTSELSFDEQRETDGGIVSKGQVKAYQASSYDLSDKLIAFAVLVILAI